MNFWGTWCEPCLEELPQFERLYRHYRASGLSLVAVATAAGMFSSMVLTLLIVPVFYLALDDLSEWSHRTWRRLRGTNVAVEEGS